MAEMPDDLLEQIGKSRVSGGGNYIQHGDYITMIYKWHYQKIQDRCIHCEQLVVRAQKKIVMHGDQKVEQEPNQPGTVMTDTANFDGDGKLSAPANARAPLLALFGFSEGQVPDSKVVETQKHVLSDVQPARGMLLKLSTFPKAIRTPRPGGPTHITGRNYECLSRPGEGVNAPHLVAARVAALRVSEEEAVKLTLRHLAEWGGGKYAEMQATEAPAAASAPTPATKAPAPSIPGLPGLPAEEALPPPLAVDLMAGWSAHPGDKNPENPTWFYRPDGGKRNTYRREEILAGRFDRE
jgi:hypothetical protein